MQYSEPVLSCQMRIFQISPRLSSVSRRNWSRLPRWKAPSLCRWWHPLLFTPYRLMPTWAVVPEREFPQYKSLLSCTFVSDIVIFAVFGPGHLILASSQSWPKLCTGTALVGHTEGSALVSNCSGNPFCGPKYPPPRGSEPAQHTQLQLSCYVQAQMPAGDTQRTKRNP